MWAVSPNKRPSRERGKKWQLTILWRRCCRCDRWRRSIEISIRSWTSSDTKCCCKVIRRLSNTLWGRIVANQFLYSPLIHKATSTRYRKGKIWMKLEWGEELAWKGDRLQVIQFRTKKCSSKITTWLHISRSIKPRQLIQWAWPWAKICQKRAEFLLVWVKKRAHQIIGVNRLERLKKGQTLAKKARSKLNSNCTNSRCLLWWKSTLLNWTPWTLSGEMIRNLPDEKLRI